MRLKAANRGRAVFLELRRNRGWLLEGWAQRGVLRWRIGMDSEAG